MATIKIEITIDANNADQMRTFSNVILALSDSNYPVKTTPVPDISNAAKPEPASQVEAKPVSTAEAKPEPAPQVETEKEWAPSLDDIRILLKAKIEKHREEAVVRLHELGATGVSNLDVAKYPDFYNFLKALS
jgi:hypothetical protein